MKNSIRIILLSLLLAAGVVPVQAQFDSQRALGGLVGKKAAKAAAKAAKTSPAETGHLPFTLTPAELPKGAR